MTCRSANRITRRIVLTLILLPTITLAACNQKPPTFDPKDESVSDWLDDCSPLDSLDGTKELTFNLGDNSVELREALGIERKTGALEAAHPRITRGRWAADEKARSVSVSINGEQRTYWLAVPPDLTGCILYAGTLQSANLQQSWVGADNPEP